MHKIYLHQWIYYNKLQWKGGLACDKPSSRVSTYFALLLSPLSTARLSLKYLIIRSSFRESALLHALCLRLLLFQHADNDHITTEGYIIVFIVEFVVDSTTIVSTTRCWDDSCILCFVGGQHADHCGRVNNATFAHCHQLLCHLLGSGGLACGPLRHAPCSRLPFQRWPFLLLFY